MSLTWSRHCSRRRRGLQIVAFALVLHIWFSFDGNANFSFLVPVQSVGRQTLIEGNRESKILLEEERHEGDQNKLESVRILGERHSGTTYLTRYLQGCFSKDQIQDALVRKKHWFQPSPKDIISTVGKVPDRGMLDAAFANYNQKGASLESWWELARQKDSLPQYFRKVWVLYLVRDPYSWMEAMRRRPWHWPNHLQIVPKNETTLAARKHDPAKETGKRRRRRRLRTSLQNKYHNTVWRSRRLAQNNATKTTNSMKKIQKSFVEYKELDWIDFVNASMMLNDDEEQALLDDSSEQPPLICHNGFAVGTLSPCIKHQSYVPPSVRHIPRSFLRHLPWDVQDPVYELLPGHRPFPHPLALRTAKIKNILDPPSQWELGGFQVLRYEDILQGNNGTQLEVLVAQLSKVLGTHSHCEPYQVLQKAPYDLPKEFVTWINDHADWHVEAKIGYQRCEAD